VLLRGDGSGGDEGRGREIFCYHGVSLLQQLDSRRVMGLIVNS
jgi:hypothetical protein